MEVDYRLAPFGLRFMRILEEVRRLQEAVDEGAVPGIEEHACDASSVVSSPS